MPGDDVSTPTVFAAPPFDRLNEEERARLSAGAGFARFPAGADLTAGAGEDLHLVVSGSVVETRGTEVVAEYGVHDGFDAMALFGAARDTTFTACEDTLCWRVPGPAFHELVRTNAAFGAWYCRQFGDRLRTLAARRTTRDLAPLVTARVRDARLRPAPRAEARTPLREAVSLMRRAGARSVMVRDGTRVGVLDGLDLLNAGLAHGEAGDRPIGPLARFDAPTLRADGFLFDALALMAGGGTSSVLVTQGGEAVGVLEPSDLLDFVAGRSRLLMVCVDRAAGLQELRRAAAGMPHLIRTLHDGGTRTRLMAELVGDLNRRIVRRLFELLAPAGLIANSCLIVMGSEGRGEQILKTDQDNGLILRDGFTDAGTERIAGEFSALLTAMGWPECPGDVMVRNPHWCRPLAGFRRSFAQWLRQPTEAAMLDLAIFYDARAVAGDPALLDEARSAMFDLLGGNDALLAHFARPTLAFASPLGLFSTLRCERLDLKKGGIFPLVHGVRSLAFEQRLTCTGTFDRIAELRARGVLDHGLAEEVSQALCALMGLRLQARLAENPAGAHTGNLIRPDDLNRMERDVLRDALVIVKRFKEFVSHHFRLTMF